MMRLAGLEELSEEEAFLLICLKNMHWLFSGGSDA